MQTTKVSPVAKSAKPTKVPYVPVTITLDYDAKKIKCHPETPVRVHLNPSTTKPGAVHWTVGNLKDEHALHFVTKETSEEYFPNREIEIKSPKKTAQSRRPIKKGRWEYTLEVTPRNDPNHVLFDKDPEVIIDD